MPCCFQIWVVDPHIPSLPSEIAILVRRVSKGYVVRIAVAPAMQPENSFSHCAKSFYYISLSSSEQLYWQFASCRIELQHLQATGLILETLCEGVKVISNRKLRCAGFIIFYTAGKLSLELT